MTTTPPAYIILPTGSSDQAQVAVSQKTGAYLWSRPVANRLIVHTTNRTEAYRDTEEAIRAGLSQHGYRVLSLADLHTGVFEFLQTGEPRPPVAGTSYCALKTERPATFARTGLAVVPLLQRGDTCWYLVQQVVQHGTRREYQADLVTEADDQYQVVEEEQVTMTELEVRGLVPASDEQRTATGTHVVHVEGPVQQIELQARLRPCYLSTQQVTLLLDHIFWRQHPAYLQVVSALLEFGSLPVPVYL